MSERISKETFNANMFTYTFSKFALDDENKNVQCTVRAHRKVARMASMVVGTS